MSMQLTNNMKKKGSRREVWFGKALMTGGRLRKQDLMISRCTGKIVSRRASEAARRVNNLGNELCNWQWREHWKCDNKLGYDVSLVDRAAERERHMKFENELVEEARRRGTLHLL